MNATRIPGKGSKQEEEIKRGWPVRRVPYVSKFFLYERQVGRW
jgi:hypothetical protein